LTAADKADRAVVLVDPFAGQAALGPEAMTGLPPLLGALISTFTQQTRYASQDLLLAGDENVFSRFLITARRDGFTGGDAIAANGLGAFIGFASPAFMRHDYLLGRSNCQRFLQTSFTLDEANPIFENMWTEAQKVQHGMVSDGRRQLPIIPLMGDAAIRETTVPWPRHALDPSIYHEAIEDRFKAAVEFEGGPGIVSSAAAWLLAHVGDNLVADYAVKTMKKALEDAGLA
jgi:hypothetical protein